MTTTTTITLPDEHATRITPHTAKRYVVIATYQDPRLASVRRSSVWTYGNNRADVWDSLRRMRSWRKHHRFYLADLETGEVVG